MAIFFTGLSKCQICNKVMEEGEEFAAFPPFINNEADKLYFFNDAAFHKKCFFNHPLAKEAIKRYKLGKQRRKGYKCFVCKKEIERDFIFIDYYTDDKKSILYKYNHSQFHACHLAEIKELPLIYSELERLRNEGVIKGDGVELLLDKIWFALNNNNERPDSRLSEDYYKNVYTI